MYILYFLADFGETRLSGNSSSLRNAFENLPYYLRLLVRFWCYFVHKVMDMMLLTTTSFTKTGASQHHTFLMEVYRKTITHFENKERLGKVWVLVTEYTICNHVHLFPLGHLSFPASFV
jgi:hypothetical protein